MNFKPIDCPDCQAEGYLLGLETGGRFSQRSLSYEALEFSATCKRCAGSGVVEVCSYCEQEVQIKQGRETCACEANELAKAA